VLIRNSSLNVEVYQPFATNMEGQGTYPLTCPAWEALPAATLPPA